MSQTWFSKSTLLSLAVLLTASIALPVVKRDTIKIGNKGWYFDLSAADTSAWAGAVSTVCASGNVGVCAGETVVATVLTGIMALGNTGSTTSSSSSSSDDNTVAITTAAAADVGVTTTVAAPAATSSASASNILGNVVSAVENVPKEIESLLSGSGVNLLGVYNISSKVSGAVQNIIHFDTSLGQHIAAQIGGEAANLTQLAEQIVKAVPGIPTFSNLTVLSEQAVQAAAKDNGENVINWMTYNIKDAEDGLTDIINSLGGADMSQFATEINNFISNNGAWKFCLSPSTQLVNVTVSESHKLFGEIYLNTYGGIDAECQ
ncbi:similar to Kazachstania africana KAFR_0C06580 hypothetical protein [Maudiozyma barnettii]|uniref:Cell wall protein n=1 Tax=Maudiozyma barnettii TaxID=61262 RepID=A0A8H2VJW5_9SACH|nr:uncharacterized protein KABA2_11S00154 [Kazachstania barnettii]CAB4256649.1 similar to Kazachstania africana KAFR_0C06580 hypothetical protein [Kazachstania barnettii]CAD1785304.1 similar to Kazachstania africana KAFR_0C06580 hypothetical protein [Kazachstania barnettii]